MNKKIESNPERVHIAEEAAARIRRGIEAAASHVVGDAMAEDRQLTFVDDAGVASGPAHSTSRETIPQAS